MTTSFPPRCSSDLLQIARPDREHQIRRLAVEFHEKAAKSFDSLRDLIVADCVLEAYDHRAQVRDRPIGHRARGAINCGNVERGSQFDCAHCWSPPRSFMIVMAR